MKILFFTLLLMNYTTFFLYIGLITYCTSCNRDISVHKDGIDSDKFIDLPELTANISNGDHIIIQVSPYELYLSEHIPGAINIWRNDYTSKSIKPYPGLMPSQAELTSLLQRLGLTDNLTLILYDHKGNVDALRFAWILSYYGFENYKLINGGLAYWKSQGLPLSNKKESVMQPSNFMLKGDINPHIKASSADIKRSFTDPNVILVDTREPYEYLALPFLKNNELYAYKKGAFDRGCIPGAIHLNWSQLADLNGDHRIKSMKDIYYDLASRGIDKDKEIILYCQSGSRTSHTYFVLTELLDYPSVKNYDGSWIEWSYLHQQDSIQFPIEQKTSLKLFNLEFNKLKKQHSGKVH